MICCLFNRLNREFFMWRRWCVLGLFSVFKHVLHYSTCTSMNTPYLLLLKSFFVLPNCCMCASLIIDAFYISIIHNKIVLIFTTDVTWKTTPTSSDENHNSAVHF